MSAQDMWARLQRDGWVEVERWLQEREPESLHLDFKTKGAPPAEQLLSDADLGNAAKALSAFANVEGGVLVFGIKAQGGSKNEADRAESAPGVSFPEVARNQLERRLSALTDPPVTGAQVHVVPYPANPDIAIVAVLAPQSDGGPHRVTFGKESQVDRYYMRITSNSLPAPHAVLAGMFGRRPPPRLKLAVCREANGDGSIFVRNHGRGIARDVFVRYTLASAHGNPIANGIEVRGWDRERPTRFRAAPLYRFGLRGQRPVHALDTVRIAAFPQGEANGRLIIFSRIDAEGMVPVRSATYVELRGGWVVDVPAAGEVDHDDLPEPME